MGSESMITNKATLEMNLPAPTEDEKLEAEDLLALQVDRFVKFCKAVLEPYKKDGMQVPTVSMKLPARFKKERVETELQKFTRELVEYHLKRVPTGNRMKQRQAVQGIYELGFTDIEKLKDLYDEGSGKYYGTSWFTILYKLKNQKPEDSAESTEFSRVQLDKDGMENLKERLVEYGKSRG
jgi:hypothetical protein